MPYVEALCIVRYQTDVHPSPVIAHRGAYKLRKESLAQGAECGHGVDAVEGQVVVIVGYQVLAAALGGGIVVVLRTFDAQVRDSRVGGKPLHEVLAEAVEDIVVVSRQDDVAVAVGAAAYVVGEVLVVDAVDAPVGSAVVYCLSDDLLLEYGRE